MPSRMISSLEFCSDTSVIDDRVQGEIEVLTLTASTQQIEVSTQNTSSPHASRTIPSI